MYSGKSWPLHSVIRLDTNKSNPVDKILLIREN